MTDGLNSQLDWSVQGWFEKGDHDFQAACTLLATPEPLTDVICFHCQQAVEKYLKGFLNYHEAEFAWVHDLRYLLNLCQAHAEISTPARPGSPDPGQ